ncbi:tetratricopeptide repeat protein [Hymenobacter weizhouensis]|uniref:tetratricopeptide repeat protein n=1 Tax=Hymenobacter sp. YIM 151500-1 TaxID=2987689 RepID=UPI002227F6E0|nr:tetratricopeptide repeat protein [Hymenobacter sp. YIM 151500-1]UYZ61483.1 tetratricopeptide repeat protein [Hymenobacter sp. YIM 151500-1]
MEQSNWPDRIILLLRQGRAVQAEQELRRVLHSDPDDALAHAWLGMALLDLGRLAEAQEHIETAIGLEPEYDFPYYLLSLAHQRQHRSAEAQQAIEQALALDPTDPNYYHVLGLIRFQRAQWEGALRAAEAGLQFDAEHVDCLGLRGRCLARLGRAPEADDSLQQALRHDPDDAGTHADAGWVALEAGRHRPALEHFRDALRRQPTSSYAREGLVEALKARYWLYRAFLRFTVWTENLGGGTRRLLFLGLYVLVRFVPVLLPLYLPLVFMSWFADPMFNGLLLLNSYGRHALSDEQRRQALAFGGVLAGGTALLVVGTFTSLTWLTPLGGGLLAALFPMMVALRPRQTTRTARWAWVVAAVLLVLGITGSALALAAPGSATYTTVMGLLVLVWIAFMWLTALS